MRKLFHTVLVMLFAFSSSAMEIKGRIELPEDWQPVVYLASLNSLNSLFVASPDFIIAESLIHPDGTFHIETSSIPDDNRFYRLYLVKGYNSSVEFNSSSHRNYQHLLIHRNSIVEIEGKIEDDRLIVQHIEGSKESLRMLDFDKELWAKKAQLSSNQTKAKRDFIKQDLDQYIKEFVLVNQASLVGLYALCHIEEKDTDFLQNSAFYLDFEEGLKKEYSRSSYTAEYSELLESLIGFREMVCEIPGVRPKWKDQLLLAQAFLIVLLLIVIVLMYSHLKRKKSDPISNEGQDQKNAFMNLTKKEQEILQLLAGGKTNKEIALKLFVELSTVKTHINSIYKQLKVQNRSEATEYYENLNQ